MKARRQATILRIIEERPIETQEALVEALREAGFSVTQSTVSRDIGELGLVKRPTPDGRYRWVAPPGPGGGPREALERARRAFADYVTGLASSGNLIVIRTLPGAAHAVAAAVDALGWPEALATLAGDDTILVVAAEEREPGHEEPPRGPVAELLKRFRELSQG